MAIATCCSLVSIPSRLGKSNPLLAPKETITPYSLGLSSSNVVFSGSCNKSTEISTSLSSSCVNGENLGSLMAALNEFLIISSAMVSVTGAIVPIQPLNSPLIFKEIVNIR